MKGATGLLMSIVHDRLSLTGQPVQQEEQKGGEEGSQEETGELSSCTEVVGRPDWM